MLEDNKDYHYVGLSFENKNYSTPDNLIFQENYYEYKTKLDLKENQVIKIVTPYGESIVAVRKANINESDLQYNKENIKEVEICQK